MPTNYLETLNRNFDALAIDWSVEVALKNWHADYQMLRLLAAELAEKEEVN